MDILYVQPSVIIFQYLIFRIQLFLKHFNNNLILFILLIKSLNISLAGRHIEWLGIRFYYNTMLKNSSVILYLQIRTA